MSGSATEGPPPPSLHGFCGVCWYFAQALTDSLREVGREVPTLGLACAAAVGSQIENWLPSSEVLRRGGRHKMHTDYCGASFFQVRPLLRGLTALPLACGEPLQK